MDGRGMRAWWQFGALAVAGLALAACNPGAAPSRPVAESPEDEAIARDARTVVDPWELVALAGGPLTADRLAGRAAERGYRLERRDDLPDLDLVLLTFRLPPEARPARVIRELEALEPGVVVGLNHAYAAEPDGGTRAGPRVYADGLLGWPERGCPTRLAVGIIDTGLDVRAPGLRGVEVTSRDFTDGASVGDAHGTAVAELLAGPGRLQGVRLFSAAAVGDVPGADPAAGVDDIMRAVAWLQASGVRLVNVSLAGPYNKILDRGLRAAAARGMVIVAAAGNDGAGAPPRYPAAFDFAIAGTAVDADLEAYDRAPRGDFIDFAAPGVDVFVPLAGGGRYLSGTSIATPFVTALIAANPDAAALGSAEGVSARLAQDTLDIGAAGHDDTFGAGLATTAAACRQAG
jgi:hypothetical protein